MSEPTIYGPGPNIALGTETMAYLVREGVLVSVEPDYEAAAHRVGALTHNVTIEEWKEHLAGHLLDEYLLEAETIVDAALGIGGDHGR